MQQWAEWEQSTPELLAEFTPGQQLVMQMPMKCGAAGPNVPLQPVRKQREIMTYTNPGGGAEYSQRARDRDSQVHQQLEEGSVSVGSTIIIKRSSADDEPETEAPTEGGWGTPFYMGDVLEVALTQSESSGTGKRKIERVTVHYRMPSLYSKFCDDICRPWRCACVAGHEWSAVCETRSACKRMKPEKATTCKFTAEIAAEAILEAQVDLIKSGALNKRSKEAIGSHDPAWAELLGVGKGQRKEKKQRLAKR